jgi:hypothetical protein
VRTRVPWLTGFCEVQLGLVPGYPLSLGGIPWARPSGSKKHHECDRFLIDCARISDRNLTTSVVCSTDMLSRKAAKEAS